MPSSYALRPVTSAETAFNKLTVSCWLKGHADGTQRSFWGIFDQTSTGRFFHLYYSSNGSLYGYWKQNEGTFFTLGTTQKFRDPNAWFHFQMTMDTTLATAADRVKFYVNGERITSFEDSLDTASPFTQNATCNILSNTDGRMIWGAGKQSGTLYYWDRYMSHCHMCVGYAYDPTEFGSTDSVTGEWKIKTDVNVNYGTNGGWWFKDSAALTDHSTNSNALTIVGGTLTKSLDNPSNNFATWNVLSPSGNNRSMENGNTYIGNNTNNSWNCLYGTLASSTGKFYCEIKDESDWGSTSDSTRRYGILNLNAAIDQSLASATDVRFSDHNYAYAYMNASGIRHSGSTLTGTTSTHPTFQEGDIIMIAMDLDNNKLYFGKNGTWNNSANPASGATGTGSVANIADGTWTFYAETKYGSDNASVNFGNGFHRTTAVTTNSGNGYAGADGKSIFTYQPPTGYSALTTLGLNQ